MKGKNELLLTDKVRSQMKYLVWDNGLIWYKGADKEAAKELTANREKWVLWVPSKLRDIIFDTSLLTSCTFSKPPRISENQMVHTKKVLVG